RPESRVSTLRPDVALEQRELPRAPKEPSHESLAAEAFPREKKRHFQSSRPWHDANVPSDQLVRHHAHVRLQLPFPKSRGGPLARRWAKELLQGVRFQFRVQAPYGIRPGGLTRRV